MAECFMCGSKDDVISRTDHPDLHDGEYCEKCLSEYQKEVLSASDQLEALFLQLAKTMTPQVMSGAVSVILAHWHLQHENPIEIFERFNSMVEQNMTEIMKAQGRVL